jgi:hypothetical protein
MEELFKKRRNQLKEHAEFNKLYQPVLDMDELVIYAINKALALQQTGDNIQILELGTKRSKENNPTKSNK